MVSNRGRRSQPVAAFASDGARMGGRCGGAAAAAGRDSGAPGRGRGNAAAPPAEQGRARPRPRAGRAATAAAAAAAIVLALALSVPAPYGLPGDAAPYLPDAPWPASHHGAPQGLHLAPLAHLLAPPAHAAAAPSAAYDSVLPRTFNNPVGVAVGPSGHIAVAESGGQKRVHVFHPNGSYSNSFKVGDEPISVNPAGVAFDGNGRILVIDSFESKVKTYNRDGSIAGAFGSSTSLPGPTGVAVGGDGTVFVADGTKNIVLAYGSGGSPKSDFGSAGSYGLFEGLSGPSAVAVAPSGRLVVADHEASCIHVVSPDGTTTLRKFGTCTEPSTGGIGGDPDKTSGPAGAYPFSDGGVWRVLFPAPGTRAGGSDGASYLPAVGWLVPGAAAQADPDKPGPGSGDGVVSCTAGTIASPAAVAVDPPSGRIAVAAEECHLVQVFNPDGTLAFSFDARTGGGITGDSDKISALAIDPSGRLFVAERSSNKVAVFELSDSGAPSVTSVAARANSHDGRLAVGESVIIDVTFNSTVSVSAPSGSRAPYLVLETGDTDRRAAYSPSLSSGAVLAFNYTVQVGDESADLGYSWRGALKPAGANITGTGSVPAITRLPAPGAAASLDGSSAVVIDAVAPTVASITSAAGAGPHGPGTDIVVTVAFDEAVTVAGSPLLALSSGATASYRGGSGTAALSFNYTVRGGDPDAVLGYASASPLTGGTIADAAGNPANRAAPAAPGAAGSLAAVSAVRIDGTAPAITAVDSAAAAGPHGPGAIIRINVTFDETVAVGGSPSLGLNAGAGAAAAYEAGSGTRELSFLYTVGLGDFAAALDHAGSAGGASPLAGGTIADAAGNPANRTMPAASGLAGRGIGVDARPLAAVNVTTDAEDGAYTQGDAFTIRVIFGSAVTIVSDGGGHIAGDGSGVPSLALGAGPAARNATYTGGSGTDTLTFRYVVQPGDATGEGGLGYRGTDSLSPNGASVRSRNTVWHGGFLLPAPGAAGSLSNNSDIVLATTASASYNATLQGVALHNPSGAAVDAHGRILVANTNIGTIAVFHPNGTFAFTMGEIGYNDPGKFTRPSGVAVDPSSGRIAVADTENYRIQVFHPNGTFALQFGGILGQRASTLDEVMRLPEGVAVGPDGRIFVADTGNHRIRAFHPNGTFDASFGTDDRAGDFRSPKGIAADPQTGRIVLADKFNSRIVAFHPNGTLDGSFGSGGIVAGLFSLPEGVAVDPSSGRIIVADTNGGRVKVLHPNGLPAFEFGPQGPGGGQFQRPAGVAADPSGRIIVTELGPDQTVASDDAYAFTVGDPRAPHVRNVTARSTGGTLVPGDSVLVDVAFDRPVWLEYGSVDPSLVLETGETDRRAAHVRGLSGGGTTLTFNYTVGEGDESAALDYSWPGSLDLRGAYISDGRGGVPALTALPPPGGPNSLAGTGSPAVDGVPPSVVGVTADASGSPYGPGGTVDITVAFDEVVRVAAAPPPQLRLDLGGGRFAEYVAGSDGDALLTFRYTVVQGHNTDAIGYASNTSLAGGTIVDLVGNVADLTLPAPGAPGSLTSESAPPVAIDTKVPTVLSVSSPNDNGTYAAESSVNVTVTFSEPVLVTGEPSLDLNTSPPRSAPYEAGSGTAVLSFNYTVSAGDDAADLNYAGTSSLRLPGAAEITDAAGNDAVTALPDPSSADSLGSRKNIEIDGSVSTILQVSSPTADGPYTVGSYINVTVTFSETVFVTGIPTLALNAGSSAAYSSGSGTPVLSFNYTVGAGDDAADLNYDSVSALSQDGTIRDGAGNNADRSLPAPSSEHSLGYLKDIVIDAKGPKVLSVGSADDDGAYNAGQVINITVTFDEDVIVTGAPTLALNTVPPRSAEYISGSGTDDLLFRYTVQGTDTAADLNYASTSALSSTGTIRDAAGNDAVRTLPAPSSEDSIGSQKDIVIDTAAPTVASVSSPTADGPYRAGQDVNVTVTFSEPVVVTGTPTLALNAGSTVDYSSGSGTATLSFVYTVSAGDNAADLNYATTGALQTPGGSKIADPAGNTAATTLPGLTAAGSLATAKGIVIDTAAPTVASVSSPTADGPYRAGQDVNVTVTFSEPVVVTGTPTLALNAGSTVDYSSGSGTATLSFVYTVSAGDNAADLNYATTTALQVPSGSTIADPAGNTAATTLPGLTAAGSLATAKGIVIDTAAPTVASVSSPTADGPYRAGQDVNVTVTFSEPVVVTGTPTLALNAGSTVDYSSGSGTATLSFVYTVSAGDNAADLNYATTTALQVPGGSKIADPAGNTATTTLPGLTAAGSLATAKGIVIDTTAPTVLRVSSPTANGSYAANSDINVTVTFSEPVDVSGRPTLALNTGSPVEYTSGSGSAVLSFLYTVADGDEAANLNYTTTAALRLPGGAAIRDPAGNDANRTLPDPPSADSLGTLKDIEIDTMAPSVLFISSPTANGSYAAPSVVNVTAMFSERVLVSGAPTLALNTAPPRNATYASGNGSDLLSFLYTVRPGDASASLNYAPGLAMGPQRSITDLLGNEANLVLPNPSSARSLGSLKDIAIDTAAPRVLRVSSPDADGPYAAPSAINITATFSERALVTGAPTIALNTDPPRSATYASGGGTDALSFVYAVQPGDLAADLDYAPGAALSGGGITDMPGNEASRGLPAAGSPESLGGSKAIEIDARAPLVAGVTSPGGDRAYAAGANITIRVAFDEPVFVGGAPALDLATSPPRSAEHGGGGNGTAALDFVYGVRANDTSPGLNYTGAGALRLPPGASIRDALGNGAVLALPAPGSPGSLSAASAIVVDGVAPSARAADSPAAGGTYGAGAEVHIRISFSEPVRVVPAPDGSLPSLSLTVALAAGQGGGEGAAPGGAAPAPAPAAAAPAASPAPSPPGGPLASGSAGTETRGGTAAYLSGNNTDTLTFVYTVREGDRIDGGRPLEYAGAGAILLNGAALTDAAGNPVVPGGGLPGPGAAGSLSAAGISVDGARAAPAIAPIAGRSVEAGSELRIAVTLASLHPGGPVEFSLLGGAPDGASITPPGVFTWTPAAGQAGAHTIIVAATDASGLSGAASFAVEVAAPAGEGPGGAGPAQDGAGMASVLLVYSPNASGAAYANGDALHVVVEFTHAMAVSGGGAAGAAEAGPPAALRLNASPRAAAEYASGAGTESLLFVYVVGPGDAASPLDYAGRGALVLGGAAGASLAGPDGAPPDAALPEPGSGASLAASNITVAAPPRPSVAGVAADPAASAASPHPEGSEIDISVRFTAPVAVRGEPSLAVNASAAGAGGARSAPYASGGGTDTLAFRYTVGPGDSSPDLGYAGAGALSVPAGGAIEAASGPGAPTAALLALPEPGSPGSLSASSDVAVDGVRPAVALVAAASPAGSYSPGQAVLISVNFTEPVVLSAAAGGQPRPPPALTLALDSGGSAAYVSGNGTAALALSYAVGAGEESARLDYAGADALALGAGASLADAAGNNASLALPEPGAAGSLGAPGGAALSVGPAGRGQQQQQEQVQDGPPVVVVRPPAASVPQAGLPFGGGGGGGSGSGGSGGGGGGGGSGRTGLSLDSGAIAVHSASWDCRDGSVRILLSRAPAAASAPPPEVSVLSSEGTAPARPADRAERGAALVEYEAPLPGDSIFSIRAVLVDGRSVAAATEAVRTGGQCIGEAAFAEGDGAAPPAAEGGAGADGAGPAAEGGAPAPAESGGPDAAGAAPAPAAGPSSAEPEAPAAAPDPDAAPGSAEPEAPAAAPGPDAAPRAEPEAPAAAPDPDAAPRAEPEAPAAAPGPDAATPAPRAEIEAEPRAEPGAEPAPAAAAPAEPPGGGCLIATAAYGTELAPQVQMLREVRDGTLLATGPGAAFMSSFSAAYYAVSPAVADLEREHPAVRHAAAALVAPALHAAGIVAAADQGSDLEVVLYGAAALAAIAGVYVAAPAAGAAAAAAGIARARRRRAGRRQARAGRAVSPAAPLSARCSRSESPPP